MSQGWKLSLKPFFGLTLAFSLAIGTPFFSALKARAAFAGSTRTSVSAVPKVVVTRTSRSVFGLAGNTFLFDQPLAIVLKGFKPGAKVKLKASMQYCGFGDVWGSWATFQADHNGVIDLSRQAPVAGTYEGVDPSGLFWSMVVTKRYQGAWNTASTGFEPTPVTLLAEVSGKTLAKANFARLNKAPGVHVVEVKESGLVGTLFEPSESGRHPVVIVLSGSDGGIWKQRAALLASHGYVALALGYFGLDGLPPHLENIPLEYFAKAIDWIKEQDSIDGSQICVMGVSRGAELALLLGANFPAIHLVVAYAPSGIVWPGWKGFAKQDADPEKTGNTKAIVAWTFHGKPIASLLDQAQENSAESIDRANNYPGPYVSRPGFLESLRNAANLEEATIKVENIQGPILLIAGKDDQVWPAETFADMINTRLKKSGFAHPLKLLIYAGAGHYIGSPYHPTTKSTQIQYGGVCQLLGGSAFGNAKASADSWPRVLQFLKENLRQRKK